MRWESSPFFAAGVRVGWATVCCLLGATSLARVSHIFGALFASPYQITLGMALAGWAAAISLFYAADATLRPVEIETEEFDDRDEMTVAVQYESAFRCLVLLVLAEFFWWLFA